LDLSGAIEAPPPNAESLPRKVDPNGEPHFTPYTKKPELANRKEVSALIARNYPERLRGARIGGTTIGWALVDERGKVVSTRLMTSSGRPELDAAALKVLAV
jgi:outer membrane biosynthesis protein TonB